MGVPDVSMNTGLATEVLEAIRNLTCWDSIIGIAFLGLNSGERRGIERNENSIAETGQ